MSGNQESRIRLPTWRCSDFNAAIPLKKRKYLVQQPVEEAASTVLDKNEQGDTSSGLDLLSSAVENQPSIGGSSTNVAEPVPSSVIVGSGETAGSVENMNIDQIRVKDEEKNFAAPLASVEIPSGSNNSSLRELPVGVEHSVADKTGMNGEQTVVENHDIVKETCGKEDCQTEVRSSASGSLVWEKEESTSLNLSLAKGVCAPENTDVVPSGVSRSNWDLNTTMDAWEDPLDRKTRVKTSGAFVNTNISLPDLETSSCRDTDAIAKSVSEKQKEIVGFKSPSATTSQFDHQVIPTCSLSLGLSSYPPVEKSSSVSSTRPEARAACTSISRNVNLVNLRTVKSEVIEESVSQETDNTQVCPIGLSISGVKQEAVARFSQGNNPSSGILKPVNPISIKSEPHNFTQSEDRLNHSHTPMMQPHESVDLPTSSTSNQKDQYSKGICNAMTISPGVQCYSDGKLNENSGQSCGAAADGNVPEHGRVGMSCSDHGNLGVNVTSLTEEERIQNNGKTFISKDIPQVCASNEDGKVREEELHRYGGFESDCGHNVSTHGDSETGQGQAARLGNTGNKHIECLASSTVNNFTKHHHHVDESASTEVNIQSGIFDGSAEKERRIVKDDFEHQMVHASEGMSGGNVKKTEIVDNKAENSSIDYDHTSTEFSEGSQNRIINLAHRSPNNTLDASGSFRMERDRDRLSDYSLEPPRKYISRASDESCKFSRERYHDKTMRSPRLNYMPDRRRFPDQTDGNMHDRDTKNFEFNNHGNTRRGRGGAYNSNFRRGRRAPNDESTPFSHSYRGRPPTFSYTHNKGTRNKEDYTGFRDDENATRGNNSEPMFTSTYRPYRGRNGYFGRGRTKFLNAPKRDFPGYRSRSPTRSRDRSRERSPSTSSSFRNRSQEEFDGNTEFSHRRSPSGYRSPDHSGYSRENVSRRQSSPTYSHRPSNGRGRGYARGRGYVRGRGYGRAGFNFRNPSDRIVHRNHGNLNNLDPRERVNYNDEFFEGPNHSERFGVDVNTERRRYGYRNDGSSSFRPSFNSDGCGPSSVENDLDAVRLGQQDHDTEFEERGSLPEIDGKNSEWIEKESDTTKNMAEEEISKRNENWQRDEFGGGDAI